VRGGVGLKDGSAGGEGAVGGGSVAIY
jgi:hypothetical protein